MTAALNESRREFLKAAAAVGGGLALEFRFPPAALARAPAPATEVTAWVMIHPDDSVVIRYARSEMGQGSFTAVPMLVAEELECDWRKVRVEYASPNEHVRRNRVWGSMASVGSRSVRESQEYLRRAGAIAREMLVAAAARGWKVPAAECAAANGVIAHRPSGREVTFGKVAAAASGMEVPRDVQLKDPREWKLLGQPVRRLDIPDKVAGKAIYGTDVRLPGMVYAAIAQCPVFGGRLKSVDSGAAGKMRGVLQVVRLRDAVTVVADNWWRANQAVKALKIDWDDGGNGDVSSAGIMESLRDGVNDANAPVARDDGGVEAAFASAAQVLEAEYYAPFLNHATMEPQNCTVWIKGNRVEVWAPTQNAEATLATAARAAGVPQQDVEVHRVETGGGFGRRGGFQDYVPAAVATAKAAGKPVQLLWSREEDMQHDNYRPVYLVKQKAALDAQGNLMAWEVHSAGQSILVRLRAAAVKGGIDPHGVACFADMPYAVAGLRVRYAMRNTHVPVGFWRTVAHSNNPFFRECFMDELAHAAGKDPYEFRRSLLRNPEAQRDLRVLDAAARAAGWGKPLPAGVHRGIAVQNSYGSYSAAVIEVSVSGSDLRIHRVVCAVDPGYVANRDGAEAQVESCVTYGLTAALFGEITIRNGRVEQSNFHDYEMMLLRHMPKVEPVLVPSGGFWGGMGEPPLAPLAPALCNAIFAATGRRVRSLPLKNHGYRVG
jgi:isoquinoline 1-oxidoreductase subunit beta